MKRMESSGFQEKRATTGDCDEDDGTLELGGEEDWMWMKRTLDYGEEDGTRSTSRRRGLQLTTSVKRIGLWDFRW